MAEGTSKISGEAMFQLSLYLLVAFGAFSGWRMSTKDGETEIPKTGFYRGTSKSIRVGVGAFAAAAGAFLLRLFADAIDSRGLAYVSVGLIAVLLGIGAGSILLGSISLARSGRK